MILRYLKLAVGLAVMSLGIAFSVRSDLGTSPISSLPYTLNLFSGWNVGQWTIAMNLVFLGAQILLLRRRFPPIQLLQIPVLLVFGTFIDVSLWVLADLSPGTYLRQWALALVGVLLVGVGVAVQVKAKATPIAGEALILTITNELNRVRGPRRSVAFGAVKVAFDTTLVVSAVAVGLAAAGTLGGVREGTVAAALLVGPVAQASIGIFNRLSR